MKEQLIVNDEHISSIKLQLLHFTQYPENKAKTYFEYLFLDVLLPLLLFVNYPKKVWQTTMTSCLNSSSSVIPVYPIE